MKTENNTYNFENNTRSSSSTLTQNNFKKVSLRSRLESIMPEIFNKIILRNQEQGKSCRTRFDCSSKITISIQNYIARLAKYTDAEESTLIHTLALIDRICLKQVYLSERNIHKLFLAALIISLKLLEDEVYTDKHYANAGGITTVELSEIEADFLALLDYKVSIDVKTFKVYYNSF